MNDEVPGPDGTMITQEYDRLVYGGRYTRKEYNRVRLNATWTNHGNKHLKAKTEEEAIKFSMSEAQYMPGINNKAIEKDSLFKGIAKHKDNSSTMYYFYNTGTKVGYDQGKAATWIRGELTSGVYHGHPMSDERVKKYLGSI